MPLGLTTSDAVTFALVNNTIRGVLNIVLKEINLLKWVDLELKRLKMVIVTIRCFLEEAVTRQIKDKSLSAWLMDLRGAAYQIDDILDDYETVARRISVVRTSFDYLAIIYITRKLALRVLNVRRRLTVISSDRKIKLSELEGMDKLDVIQVGETSSLIVEPHIIGRGGDKENIISLMLKPRVEAESSHRVVPVIPIVGLAGLGKTALAQLIFNDDMIESQFELRMWVSVSDDFDVKRICKEIIECVENGTSVDVMNLNALQDILKERIRGKKFFLVLDNVWNEDHEKWESLCIPLAAGGPGSMVLVTTQNRRVADITGTMEPYVLKCLSKGDMWSVLRNCSFRTEYFVGNPKLEEIGREITNKLNGLPYGAKKIGQFLRHKPEENNWKQILKAKIWEMPPGAMDLLSALLSSFEHLPNHLKLCFFCCSLFPKGYKFQREKLVWIWMAHNLIQPMGARRPEDIGREYFNELVSRSFFQNSGEDYDVNGSAGDLASSVSSHEYFNTADNFQNSGEEYVVDNFQNSGEEYVMHESVHDLAKFVSLDEYASLDNNSSVEISETIRHLAWCRKRPKKEHLDNLMNLRTLLFFRPCNLNMICMFRKLRLLRVLDLSNCCDIRELPKSIKNLEHLRYLSLYKTGIKKLPDSLTSLYHLQTLILEQCRISKLPKNMSMLVNLRHLISDPNIVADISSIGGLAALQKLEIYRVCNKSKHRIIELQGMNQLQGNLLIKGLQHVQNRKEAADAELNKKKHLSCLHLEWDPNGVSYTLHGQVLEDLQPHRRLKELKIKCYMGELSPSWMLDQYLANIETIRLFDCKLWRELPPLGSLQFLKHLEIEGMREVSTITAQFYGEVRGEFFPSLEVLYISDMPKLVEWKEHGPGTPFPRLLKLYIKKCPKLLKLPPLGSLQFLKHLEIEGMKEVSRITAQFYGDVEFFSSLEVLYFSDMPNLVEWEELGPRRSFPRLLNLFISSCPKLRKLPPLGSLQFLKHLEIEGMNEVSRITAEFYGEVGSKVFPSLEVLYISDMPNLVKWKELSLRRSFPRLLKLSIGNCPKLWRLPALPHNQIRVTDMRKSIVVPPYDAAT